MAHRKAGGSAKNLRDSNPKYLGVKLNDKQPVKIGQIILKQRGTKYIAGHGVAVAKDHTLFAKKEGIVSFSNKIKVNFTGKKVTKKIISIEQ